MMVMVVVLAIGGVSFGGDEVVETRPTAWPATTQPAGLVNVSDGADFYMLIGVLSTSDKVRGVRPPEFLEDVIRAARKWNFSSDNPLDGPLSVKRGACTDLIRRVKRHEKGDLVGDFLRGYDVADKKLKQVAKEEIARTNESTNKTFRFLGLLFAILFPGFFVGNMILQKRDCPVRASGDLQLSVVPLALVPFFMLYRPGVIDSTGFFYLSIGIFFFSPIIVALVLKKHRWIDARVLQEKIKERITGKGYSRTKILKVVRNLVYDLASPGGNVEEGNHPIDASDILHHIKKVRGNRGPLTGQSLRSVDMFIDIAIRDKIGPDWDGNWWKESMGDGKSVAMKAFRQDPDDGKWKR
jgi:hypothetical protein